MTPAIDTMIQKAVLLRRIVQEIADMIDQCDYKSSHAPEMLRPVYRQLKSVLTRDALTTESVAHEMAEYLGQQTAELSTQQRSEMVEFIEMCRQPLFVGLGADKTGYVAQVTNVSGMRDC